MWNGSLDKPTVGSHVNRATPGRTSDNLCDWVRLESVEPEVLTVCLKLIPRIQSIKSKSQLVRILAEKQHVPQADTGTQPRGVKP